MANQHIGSSFDDFLAEEDILDECKEDAQKKFLFGSLKMKMHTNSL